MTMANAKERVSALARVLGRACKRGMSQKDLDRALLELIRVTATVHGVETLGPQALRMLGQLPGTKSKVHASLWLELVSAYREAMRTEPSIDRSQLRRWSGGLALIPVSNQRLGRSERSPLGLLIEERTTKGRSN